MHFVERQAGCLPRLFRACINDLADRDQLSGTSGGWRGVEFNQVGAVGGSRSLPLRCTDEEELQRRGGLRKGPGALPRRSGVGAQAQMCDVAIFSEAAAKRRPNAFIKTETVNQAVNKASGSLVPSLGDSGKTWGLARFDWQPGTGLQKAHTGQVNNNQ